MGDEETTTTVEETAAPAVDPAAVAPAAEPAADPAGAAEPEPEGGKFPGVERLLRERDEARNLLTEERVERARAEARLEAMQHTAPPAQQKKGMTPEERRALYDADPFRYQEMVRQELEQTAEERVKAIERASDNERASEILTAAPESAHPEFVKRIAAIMMELWPGDAEDKMMPARLKAARALKEYRREFTDTPGKIIPDKRPAPPGGRRAVSSAPLKEPTPAEMDEATRRYHEAPDATGKGWGARKTAEWKKARLL